MSEARLLITALCLFAAMCLAGYIGWRRRVGSVLLALLSVVWLTVDRDWEGGIIWTFDRTHGLTTADFVGIAGGVAATWLWWRRRG